METPYDKMIVKKMNELIRIRDSNQKYIPSFIEPTITTHLGNRKISLLLKKKN
jgi:hypothetical protein